MGTITTIQSLLMCNGSARPVTVELTPNTEALIAASPTLLEAAIAVSKAAVKRAAWGRDNVPAMREEQRALADLRAAITLATGKDA